MPGCQTLVTGVRLRRSASNLAIVSTTILDTPPGLGLQDNSEDSLGEEPALRLPLASRRGVGKRNWEKTTEKGCSKDQGRRDLRIQIFATRPDHG